MLMEQSIMEQRYDAVMGVIRDGFNVTEVAEKYGVTRQTVHSWLRRIARRAGITKPVGPHTLRHAFITAALDVGVPLRDVQEAASHADPRTTMRYDRARVSLDRHATYIVSAFVVELHGRGIRVAAAAPTLMACRPFNSQTNQGCTFTRLMRPSRARARSRDVKTS